MDNETFNGIVEYRKRCITEVLQKKAEEYASNEDRLHNFKVAARMLNVSPEQALRGIKIKHDVSVNDLIDWTRTYREKITVELIDEKIGDSINYLILLEALLRERVENTPQEVKNGQS